MSEQLSFEKAFMRLEEILEKMNAESVSLDDSVKLFEEAHMLIKKCEGQIASAESKVESLIKTKEGSLALDEKGYPQKEGFNSL